MVILVDENDRRVGEMEKMEAHRKDKLHRAFSVFIFNSRGEMLLQRRAVGKYHSGGLWTNACCSHPRPGEDTEAAAHRRLEEEMGLSTGLVHLFTFHYRVMFENGLWENEIDHVFIGRSDDIPVINTEEVAEYAWLSWKDIRKDIEKHPEKYTVWFQVVAERYGDLIERAKEVISQ